MSATQKPDRLRTLLEAGIAISSELSLDAVLQRLVEAAARVTEATYAALGVIDTSGTGLERFATTGIDADARAAIGDLPRGLGILGVLIKDARTLRLHDLGKDLRSVGFPPNHPPMRRSSARRSCCTASPTATSTSPRRRAAPTLTRRTKNSSRSSPAGRPWRSRWNSIDRPHCTTGSRLPQK